MQSLTHRRIKELADPAIAMQTNDERIAWVLAHPQMSPWLKAALRSATQCHPVEVQNHLEILNLLLRAYVADGLAAEVGGPDPLSDELRAE